MFTKRRSLDELLETKRQLDAELAERGTEELVALKAKLELLAEAQGMRISDLFPSTAFASSEEPRRRRRKREIPPKYRNPETGETWSGLGRPKKWLQEKLDAGARMEDFAIA